MEQWILMRCSWYKMILFNAVTTDYNDYTQVRMSSLIDSWPWTWNHRFVGRCPTNQGCRISRCPSGGGGCPDDGNRMEIAWRKTCDRSHLWPKNSFLFFLFGKQFQAFLKGRSGDVIPKGSLVLGKSALIFTSLICNTLQEQIPITFPIIFQGSTCYSFSLFRPQRCGTGHSIRTVLALLHGCGCCGV